MKLFRLSVLCAVLLAVAAGGSLFWTSQNVQQMESRLRDLRQATSQEQKTIRVLRAEWDYLNSPQRLESLAAEYMILGASDVARVGVNADILPEHIAPVLPRRKPLFAVQPVMLQAPVASLAVKSKYRDKKTFQALLNQLDQDKGGAP